MVPVIRMYAYLLKLYPASFREAFADEMLDVFAVTFGAALSGESFIASRLWYANCGIYRLVFGLCKRDLFNRMPASARVATTSALVRANCCRTLGMFLLSTYEARFPNYHLYPQAILFVMLLFVTALSMLMAIRWERLGGLRAVVVWHWEFLWGCT